MKARIINNVAVDVCADPEILFHPEIAAEFVDVPETVGRGYVFDPETDTWNPPEHDAEPAAEAPEIVITGIVADAEHASTASVASMGEITCTVGTTLTIAAELRSAAGDVIPLTDNFRMPFRSRDGREKVLLAVMVDGLVSINAPIKESGVWITDEAAINEALPESNRMKFAGITVYVVEA